MPALAPQFSTDSLDEGFFLRNMVQQLASWHDKRVDIPDERRVSELRALYFKYLGQPVRRRAVVIVDGLDEVTGWRVAQYFGQRLPRRLNVILSVRDVGQNVLDEFALPRAHSVQVRLGGLTHAGVAAVLRQAGGAAASIAAREDLLERFVQKARYAVKPQLGADPFYVRFLAEDAATLTLTTDGFVSQTQGHPVPLDIYVNQRPRGLDRYLNVWWTEIKSIAGSEPVQDLFGTLTVASGAITREDLERINPNLHRTWPGDYFDEVIAGKEVCRRRCRRQVCTGSSTVTGIPAGKDPPRYVSGTIARRLCQVEAASRHLCARGLR